jgi:hypothetical protein
VKLDTGNILGSLEQLNYELSTETRLVRVGLKDEQQTGAILQKFSWLCGKDVVEFLERRVEAAAAGDEREKTERLRFAIAELYLYRQVAPLVDGLQTALSKKTVRLDGDEVAHYNLHPRLQNEPDFDRREQIGGLVDRVHEEFNPQKLAILRRELQILTVDLGFPSYIEFCRLKKQFKYLVLLKRLRESLARTEPIYRKHVALWTEQKIGKPFGNLNRYHASFLMKLADFDRWFPKDTLTSVITTTLRHLGIDLQNLPNVKLDLEERPRKNPRAFCSAAKIPDEIWLVIKPVGGLLDYETFLHEAGHALHFGCSDAKLPYEYRHLSRSYALSEIYSFLLQNLVQDTGWLRAATTMDDASARQLRYYKILTDLYMYRRYVAKFSAEYEFFQQSDLDNGDIYAKTLTAATGFIYKPLNYLFDMDGGFYSADYLRAWLGEAQLREHLVRAYGAAWWANASAGRFLLELWQESGRPDAEQVIAQIGGKPLDTNALERRFAELNELAGSA